MRLVEERRKVFHVHARGHLTACFHLSCCLAQLKENELKTRLRAKSARVRVPAPAIISEADEDAAIVPAAWTDQRVPADLSDPASFGQVEREEAEGEERVRERTHRAHGETGRSEGGNEDGDGEEEKLTQVVELMHEVYDSRCQSPEDKETF